MFVTLSIVDVVLLSFVLLYIKKEYNHSNIVYISSSNQIVMFKVEYPDDHIQGSPC